MQNNRFDIGDLIAKFLRGQLTREETERLAKWVSESESNQRLLESIQSAREIESEVEFIEKIDMERAWSAIRQKRKSTVISSIPLRMGWVAAMLVLGSVLFWWLAAYHWADAPTERLVSKWGEDLLPASNKATLVLPSGERIPLADSSQLWATRADLKMASSNGELQYLGKQSNDVDDGAYNTLTVPKGGMFRLVLPDSTRVWLNAESELRFPVAFAASARRVFLKGEAFFEVQKSASKPFVVETDKTAITVLGTTFNVSTFTGVATTLVSGSVRITTAGQAHIMQPGELAQVYNNEIEITHADLEKALAWKNGEFFFKREQIEDIMDELSRWYGFEVVYEGTIPEKAYTGGMARGERLSAVLEMLAYVFNADFQIEGKTVVARFSTG